MNINNETDAAILATILDYAEAPPKYALMLSGEWGSGKTHFCRNALASALKNSGAKQDGCIVTLSGIKTIEQLTPRLLAALFSLAGKKTSENEIRAATVFANWTKRIVTNYFGLPNSSFNINLGALSPLLLSPLLKSRFLVLDDVERCELSFVEIGAFVTDFVEKSDTHILLVANEQKLIDRDAKYLENKEKVVGETVRFIPNREKIIRNICQGEFSVEFGDCVGNGMIEAIKYFEDSHRPNLRSVQSAVRLLKRVERALGSHWDEKNILIADLARVAVVALSVARDSEAIRPELSQAMRDPASWWTHSAMADVRNKRNSSHGEEVPKSVTTSVLDFCYRNEECSKFSLAVCAEYLEHDRVDAAYILKCWQVSSNMLDGIEPDMNLRFIAGEFWNLSSEELNKLGDHFLERIENGDIADAVEIWTIVKRLFWFSESRLLAIQVEEIDRRTRVGVAKLKARGELNIQDLRNLKDAFDNPTGIALEMNKFLVEESTLVQTEQLGDQVRDFIKGGNSKFAEFVETILNRWQAFPVLHIPTESELLGFVLSLSNDNLRKLNACIQNRYNSSNIGEFLGKEMAPLNSLADQLESRETKAAPISPSEWMRSLVIIRLRQACERLGATASVSK